MTTGPQRVVSLVPSDTYTLIRLGVGDRLVGRTEYCVEPEEAVREIPVMGGTKNADVAAILAAEPDLVVVNREENRKKDVEELVDALGDAVLMSFPKTVHDGLVHARRLAALFGVEDRPELEAATAAYEALAHREGEAVRAFVPIWMDPLMTVHHDTFISDALELCGGRNVFSDRERRYPLSADLGKRDAVAPGERDTRYPRVTLDELAARDPALVLLPDEPHAFTEEDAHVFREALPRAAVRFCDGRDLMWYGLRSLEGLDRIAGIIAGIIAEVYMSPS